MFNFDYLQQQQNSAVMVGTIRKLLSASTFHWMGVRDQEESARIIRETRKFVPTVMEHYAHHGRSYLPAIDSPVGPRLSWLLVFSYLLMTRGNIHHNSLHQMLYQTFVDEQRTIVISRLIVNFVHDYRSWKNHDSVFRKILSECGLGYATVQAFPNGDDVLCLANLVGLSNAKVLNIDHVMTKVVISDEIEEALDNHFPPPIVAILGHVRALKARKAFAMNLNTIQSGWNSFVGVKTSQTELREVITMLLRCVDFIRHDEPDENLANVVDLFIEHVRKSNQSMIPQRRDDELNEIFKKRLGIGVYIDTAPKVSDNDVDPLAVYKQCAIMVMSLAPEGIIQSLN